MVFIQARLRPGIYWDAHNIARACRIVEVAGRIYTALDARTGERLLDPPSAIAIGTAPGPTKGSPQ